VLHFVDNMSVHSNLSANTMGPGFQLDLSSLVRGGDFTPSEEDNRRVVNVVRRHMSAVKKVRVILSSCHGGRN